MSPDSEKPPELGPEAREALHQLRDGLRRARVIVREAKQAIGQPAPEGAVLGTDSDPKPEDEGPVMKAD